MPAPVIQSVTPTTQSTHTDCVAAPPPSIADGDLMLALHSIQDATSSSPTASPPAGGWADWITQLGWPRNRLTAISKIAASESGNYTFTSNATLDHIVAILRITGQAAAGYLHQSAADGAGEVARTSFVCPEVSTTIDNCLILYCVNWTGNVAPTGTPAGCDEKHNAGLAGETSSRLVIYSKTLATAGPSGTGTYTVATVRDGSAFTLAIAPSNAKSLFWWGFDYGNGV